jgi:cobalt-precorrin 5A hydrolase / precorrin-3B C17-methyltransferase
VSGRGGNEPVSDEVPDGAVLVVLGPGGLALARDLCAVLPGASVHGYGARVDGADETFDAVGDHLRGLFVAGRPIVGVCAAGILIRALAPLVSEKASEPPVVAVAEDGSTAVPLLGGHGGANRLARAIAGATGGTAAVTTAGDVRHGIALDDPPPGWMVANRDAAKGAMAAVLAGEPVALRHDVGDGGWLAEAGIPFRDTADLTIRVTDQTVADTGADLILHPPVLAVGVGCERDTDAAELTSLVTATLAEAGLAAGAVACVASLDVKADEAAVHAVAAALGVEARFFDAPRLETETPRLANPSDVVFREVGCHGVAEGAALAVAGADGELIVEKHKSARATCAVARASAPIDVAAIGQGRGSLAVVGIGPGAGDWRTPEATQALRQATDIVGYGLYLDLIADVIAGKHRHDSQLSEEEARVRIALDLAAEGKTVALVSSGDAGIYALATLVFELLEREDRAVWNRIAITVSPGVSALQAAAARIGAPIGHDFCTVSLSDLLTPWEDIERRLRAAADGDFVVALYNPVSKRRRTQLAAARDILLRARPAETPVVLARNLGREGESIDVITLAELTPDAVDMLTLVLIGSSHTRRIQRGGGRWVYTPRGYASKMADTDAPPKEKA